MAVPILAAAAFGVALRSTLKGTALSAAEATAIGFLGSRAIRDLGKRHAALDVTVDIEDRDLGWKRVKNEVEHGATQVTVGVRDSDDGRNAGGIGNVALAAIHEFGSERAGIPERSFLRLTADKNANKYRLLAKRLGREVYRGRITKKQSLNLLGLQMVADVRDTFDHTPSRWPALKEATIAARFHGGTKPLVDTGQLRGAISHKVE